MTEKTWGVTVASRMVRDEFFKEETEDEKVLGAGAKMLPLFSFARSCDLAALLTKVAQSISPS